MIELIHDSNYGGQNLINGTALGQNIQLGTRQESFLPINTLDLINGGRAHAELYDEATTLVQVNSSLLGVSEEGTTNALVTKFTSDGTVTAPAANADETLVRQAYIDLYKGLGGDQSVALGDYDTFADSSPALAAGATLSSNLNIIDDVDMTSLSGGNVVDTTYPYADPFEGFTVSQLPLDPMVLSAGLDAETLKNDFDGTDANEIINEYEFAPGDDVQAAKFRYLVQLWQAAGGDELDPNFGRDWLVTQFFTTTLNTQTVTTGGVTYDPVQFAQAFNQIVRDAIDSNSASGYAGVSYKGAHYENSGTFVDALRSDQEQEIREKARKYHLNQTAHLRMFLEVNVFSSANNKETFLLSNAFFDLSSLTALGGDNSNIGHLEKAINALDGGIKRIRGHAQSIGANVAILQIRKQFSDIYTTLHQLGAEEYTLADLNEESANLVALQVRQQIGVQSLAFAGQQHRAILSFLRS